MSVSLTSSQDREGGGRVRLLNLVMQLRKACNHPYLFDGRGKAAAIGHGRAVIPLWQDTRTRPWTPSANMSYRTRVSGFWAQAAHVGTCLVFSQARWC